MSGTGPGAYGVHSSRFDPAIAQPRTAAFLAKTLNPLSASRSSWFIRHNGFLQQGWKSFEADKLFVGGLSYGTDDHSLKDAFSSFGEVVEARVITDRDSGRSRGFGFVNFSSDESASSALSAMDGQELHGRSIRAEMVAIEQLLLFSAFTCSDQDAWRMSPYPFPSEEIMRRDIVGS
ncbi:hypothetical protein NL676_021682 [Syzygium grande]|nr:hypothetical protein NL676_021682 [Syzygium grande]